MFYKFINENSIKACPMSGYINGRAISNLPRYLEKNPDIAKAEGYKKLVIDDKPEFDSATQYLTFSYEDIEDVIVKHWVVNNIPQAEEPTDIESRISELEEKLEAAEILLGVSK